MWKNYRLSLFVSASLLITTIFWILAKSNLADISARPLGSLSQIFALWGVVMVSLTLLLSTRLSWLEDLFGGLDKVFKIHHQLGAIGFILILNHPLLLALEAMPSAQNASQFLVWGSILPLNIGITGIYLMVISFSLMVFVTLPYHWWLKTHQFLGWGFLMGGVHAFLIGSDIGISWPLKIWMLAWIILAFTAALYSLIWQKLFQPRKWYHVIEVEIRGSIIVITLDPVSGKPLKFKAGQFVQVSFENPSLSREYHPFSIASGPNEIKLQLAIKMLGDYTQLLPNLKLGDLAAVAGPFGRFIKKESEIPRKLLSEKKTHSRKKNDSSISVWIGAGIGVTPFLSLLKQETYSPQFGEVWFYYCFKNPLAGTFLAEINQLIPQAPHIHFIPWQSDKKGRLSMAAVTKKIPPQDINSLFLCGPTQFMESIAEQAKMVGVDQKNIQYEEFNFAA